MTHALVDIPPHTLGNRIQTGLLLAVMLAHGLLLLPILQFRAPVVTAVPTPPLIISLIPPKPEAVKPAPTPVTPKTPHPVVKPEPVKKPVQTVLAAKPTPTRPANALAPAPVESAPTPSWLTAQSARTNCPTRPKTSA